MEVVGLVVPQGGQEMAPTLAIEEGMEVIEREEAPSQTVRIFRMGRKEVVVVEEEKTMLEVRRLCSTLNNAMKKIEVS